MYEYRIIIIRRRSTQTRAVILLSASYIFIFFGEKGGGCLLVNTLSAQYNDVAVKPFLLCIFALTSVPGKPIAVRVGRGRRVAPD